MRNRLVSTCIGLLLLSTLSTGDTVSQAGHGGSQKRMAIAKGSVPAKAIDVYKYVLKTGKPPRGFVGGRTWYNREKRLPRGGDYREYDVNPKVRGKNRGAERIIIDMRTMKGWYTADHYRTFMPIRQ